MPHVLHPSLVALSLLIAVLAVYLALDFSARIDASRTRGQRITWYAVGTWILGMGLWALHFVGMLSRLPHALHGFAPLLSVASGIAALAAAYVLLRAGDAPMLGRARWLSGALAAGLAIAFVHLFCSASLEPAGASLVRPRLWAIWIAMATLAAACVLPVMHRFHAHTRGTGRRLGYRMAYAAGFGVLIVLWLHLAISVSGDSAPARMSDDARDAVIWAGSVASLVALLSMATALGLSEFVTRLYLQSEKLSGSVTHLSGQLQYLTTHDALTGLPNRPMLVEHAEQALAGATTGHGRMAILYLDLDGFKTINDTLGHSFGDELLRAVATRLGANLRADSLARMGGDEFVAVLDKMTSAQSAIHIAKRLLEQMQVPFLVCGTELRVTASIGIACHPQHGDTVEYLIAHADAAMYVAKENGRNGYRLYDRSMQARSLRTLVIQRGLQTAMEDGSLSLHFQPKHHGGNGSMVGAEALLRWRHPELGQVSPMEFIGVAERSGQIIRIGEWVIREACRQQRCWIDRGMVPVPVAINLSPTQIAQPGLVETAAGIVAEAGLHPSQIMFEITESMAMQDAERTTAVLNDFHARGFALAIDDFGTGYSSLAYLRRFQVRQLKIDQFFINALEEGGEQASAMVKAIIELAHTLDMEVVAEGVETSAQAEVLRGLGCDQVQGYFLARPMPAGEFERCLASAPVHRIRA